MFFKHLFCPNILISYLGWLVGWMTRRTGESIKSALFFCPIITNGYMETWSLPRETHSYQQLDSFVFVFFTFGEVNGGLSCVLIVWETVKNLCNWDF